MKTQHATLRRGRNLPFRFTARVESLEARTLLNATIDVDANGRLTYQTDPAAVSSLTVSEVNGVYTFAVGAADAPIEVNTDGGLTVTGGGTRSVSVTGPSSLVIVARAQGDSIRVASDDAPTTITVDEYGVAVVVSVVGMSAGSAISIVSSVGLGSLELDAGGLPLKNADFQVDGSGRIIFTAPAPQGGTVTFSRPSTPVPWLASVTHLGMPIATLDSNVLTAADPAPVEYVLRSVAFAPGTTIANYPSAQIRWGDGTTSAGVIVADPESPNQFNIMGSHAYAASGLFNTIVDYVEYTPNGYFQRWSGQGEAIAVTPPAAMVVASFTPPPGWAPSDFRARILWGDNASTSGRVVADADDPNVFNVTGTHVYAQAGSYVTGVVLTSNIQVDSLGWGVVDADSTPVFNSNSLVIQGGLNPDYGISGGGPPGSHPGIPPSPPPFDDVLFQGSVNAASPRINVYATPQGGGSPILLGQGDSNALGAWTFSTPSADVGLADGVYTIQVQAFDDADGRSSALTTIDASYLVGTPPPPPVGPLVIDGLINPTYGPFPPPPAEPLPPGVTRDPTALISGHVNAAAPRIDLYATPAGGGAPLLFGHGSINESISYPTYQEAYWYFAPVTSSIPDGVYTIQVQAFDDSNNRSSELTTIATGFVVYTPRPVVESKTLDATAGVPLTDVVVATFTAAPGASAADFSPLILWGDNAWSVGSVVVDPNDPTRFDVLGSHTYAQSGSFTPGVIVQPGDDWAANGYSGNAVAVAGGFGDGQIQATGLTNQNEPLLIGRTNVAEGGARIVAYATNEAGGSILIGQGVSGPAGYWRIQPDVPLPDGRYSIQIQAIDDASHVGSAVTTIATGLVVDTVGPRIVGVQLQPGRGQVVVTYQDAGSGLDLDSVRNPASYSFSQQPSGPAPWTVTSVVAAPPFRTAPQRATVVINGGRPIRGGSYLLTVRSAGGVRDRAGNPLQGGFDGRFPSRGAGDFNALLTVVQGRASRPRAAHPAFPGRFRPQAVLASRAWK